MKYLEVGSNQWRAVRRYLLSRAMYRAANVDPVAKAYLKRGCDEVSGVGLMENVVTHLPGAILDEGSDTAAELSENIQSQAEVTADLEADDPGRSENENRLALTALEAREEVLRNALAIFEFLMRDFPPVVGDPIAAESC